MDIDEEIQAIRSKQDRMSVGEQLAKEQEEIVVEDIYRTYFSVIDLVIEDFGLKGDYDCYYEDGVPYMAFRQEDCTFADGYDTELTDGMIVVDLNGMTKDDGCAGYGTEGMHNARYSDKPKKSKTSKQRTYDIYEGAVFEDGNGNSLKVYQIKDDWVWFETKTPYKTVPTGEYDTKEGFLVALNTFGFKQVKD